MPSMFAAIQAVVREIPRGKISTYGAVAKAAGFPGAARQVVWALRAGRGLPWHRVVAAGGRIALPGDSGMEQRLRLQQEGVAFRGAKADIAAHEHKFMRTQKRSAKGSPQKRNAKR
ncbi:MAG TPA: MGMT family protein [Terriglobales bacterium]|nr:MGMT family protein [Terriglobales bacterium]